MLTEEQYNFIAEGCEDMELDAIWDYFSRPFGTKFLSHDLEYFDSRKDGFLWVLERLIKEARVTLVDMKTRAPLEGDSASQIDRFRRAFPNNDTEMEGGLWFFSSSCPGGAAWQKR